MGGLADRCSLHARFLNESKGPAVRALRQQMDKPAYRELATGLLRAHSQPGDRRRLGRGSDRSPERYAASAAPDGRTFSRKRRRPCDRDVPRRQVVSRRDASAPKGASVKRRPPDWPQHCASSAFRRSGSRRERRRESTSDSVDYAADDAASRRARSRCSSRIAANGALPGPQLPCHIDAKPTRERTHLVRENLHRSPLYGLDLIRGIGPRYCPSIEDKVVKFAHNPTHQIFVEPEGWEEPTLYVGGFSTSLPAEVQLAMLHTLPGLEGCRMLRAGLRRRVRLRAADRTRATPSRRAGSRGLFHCGQLNGTSGYEEAAAQGLIAGSQRRARGARRRAAAPRPRARLHRRADRRSRDPRRRRALSHADLARRASRRAAPRQRRSAPDAARARDRTGRRCGVGALRAAAIGARIGAEKRRTDPDWTAPDRHRALRRRWDDRRRAAPARAGIRGRRRPVSIRRSNPKSASASRSRSSARATFGARNSRSSGPQGAKMQRFRRISTTRPSPRSRARRARS